MTAVAVVVAVRCSLCHSDESVSERPVPWDPTRRELICGACLSAEAESARELSAIGGAIALDDDDAYDHKQTCRFCANWRGPVPLGGLRAACERPRERRAS